MKRPNAKVVRDFALATQNYPDAFEWLTEWYNQEVEQLISSGQNVALLQGRCQALRELIEFTKKAPAQARSQSTHTDMER